MSRTQDFLLFLKDMGLFNFIFPSGLQQTYGHRTCYITTFYMVCTFWTPISNQKGPIKQGQSVLPSIFLFILLSLQALELYHQFFLSFGMVLETCMKLCMAELDFLGKKICPKNWENGPRMGQKLFFLNLLKYLIINFYRICSLVNICICCVPKILIPEI